MWEVSWRHEAVQDLLTLSRVNFRQASRISDAVELMGHSEHGDLKKLRGTEKRWRLRVGDWRVIFDRDGSNVDVIEVTNRRDAYD